MKVIILAAGIGKRLKNFTKNPKCLIKIKNETLLKRYIKAFQKFGINDITIVTGYKSSKVTNEIKKHKNGIKILKNNDYSEGSILSLWTVKNELNGDILIADGDLYFEEKIIKTIITSKKKNFFLIDRTSPKNKEAVFVGFKKNKAVNLARGLKGNYEILGEWAGFLKLSAEGAKKLFQLLQKKILSGERQSGYEFIIPELFNNLSISYELINGLKWIEIDYPKDIKKAEKLI